MGYEIGAPPPQARLRGFSHFQLEARFPPPVSPRPPMEGTLLSPFFSSAAALFPSQQGVYPRGSSWSHRWFDRMPPISSNFISFRTLFPHNRGQPSPTSLHWNFSVLGKTVNERQGVTDLLDEFSYWLSQPLLRYNQTTQLHWLRHRSRKVHPGA